MIKSALSRNLRIRPGFSCATLLSLLLWLGLASTPALADQWSSFGEDYPAVQYATEAAVMDADGNVLYSLNGYSSMAMASTTKIMTAVVALESGVDLDTVYTVSDVVNTVYGQLIGYQPGDQATLNELLHGLMVYSGNDAAVCIAECVGGSVDNFVAMMNEKAASLGMSATHYANPHGLDEDGHYSSPVDLINLARYASQYTFFNDIVGSKYTILPVSGEERYYESTDALNGTYPGIQGVKTGYTYAAGNCFVAKATVGGQTLYACVLGCELSDQRWEDMTTLLDWAFSHYSSLTIANGGDYLQYVSYDAHFGWSVVSRFPAFPTYLDGDGKSVLASTGLGSLSDGSIPTSSVEVIGSDGTVDGLRSTGVEGIVYSSHAFGPLNSALFN